MGVQSQRKPIALFVVAVALPCALLVALTLRMISQERELAEQRLVEARATLASQLRQALLSRLEGMGSAQLSARSLARTSKSTDMWQPAVRLVARIERDDLVLPWEDDPDAATSRRVLHEMDFARRLQAGERAEAGDRDLASAASAFRAALASAKHPVQRAYARLLLARSLGSAGRTRDALAHFRALLAAPPGVMDDQDVPIALYAAARLLDAGVPDRAILDRLAVEAERSCCAAPAAAYLGRELAHRWKAATADSAARASATRVTQRLDERVRLTEHALELEREFPTLGLGLPSRDQSESRQSRWILFPRARWLVGVVQLPDRTSRALVAVAADEVLAAVDSSAGVNGRRAAVRLAIDDRGMRGTPLGPMLPDVQVVFPESSEHAAAAQWRPERRLYIVTLVLVVGATLFGAYLLSRDVRRELRLSATRAQFVSSVSHELKTPLTAIRMFAETLQNGDAADAGMRSECVDTIVNETERLSRLLNNVLDASKIERDQKTYHRVPTALPDVIRRAARVVQYPLTQLDFSFVLEIDDDTPSIPADADAVEQAVLNLLSNAIKYSGDARRIQLRLARRDGDAVIEVTDDGGGITPRDRERIFEMFYRAESPENQRIPGTGIGLSIVDHIVRAHGGRVAVRSAIGKGSTFAIHLPLGSPPPS